MFYFDPKRSAKDKEHDSFPSAVFKTKEQQESGQTLLQAYQVVLPLYAERTEGKKIIGAQFEQIFHEKFIWGLNQ